MPSSRSRVVYYSETKLSSRRLSLESDTGAVWLDKDFTLRHVSVKLTESLSLSV